MRVFILGMNAVATLSPGTRLGRYEIVSLLGRGGMGEVYAADDSNLGRRIALKILPSNRTADPDRVARFLREARASSALNHPAIVSVHDAGSEGSVHFLAMELIAGQTLALWACKRRSARQICDVMTQVAAGLGEAHAAGIVHRDLKPENVMVTREGYAKIVDFGVAKLVERTDGRAHTGISTPSARIGTTPYMAPEQVEARPVDHRADVFAFGVVLYELLTGTHPFASAQYADTLHNIVHSDPPLSKIAQPMRRVVRRCLQKDPELRYDSMKDVALDLREIPDSPAQNRSHLSLFLLLAVAALIAAAALILRDRPATERVRSPAAETPAPVMTRLTSSGNIESAAVTPDGRYVVYAARERDLQALYIKQIATGTVTQIAPAAPVDYLDLTLSPDGNYVYYVSTPNQEPNVASIHQLPLLGGNPRTIAHDTEFRFAVSPDGQRIVFVRFNALDRRFRLTTAAVDGSGEKVLLESSYPRTIDKAVWEPGGTAITFLSGIAGTSEAPGLRRFDERTGTITQVTTPSFPGVGPYLWLRDGSGALVSVYERDQPPQIWFVPTGSTSGRKVTADVSAYYSVSASADSRSFVTVRDTTDSNVYTFTIGDDPDALQPVTSGIGNFTGVGGVRWLNDRELLYSGIEAGMNTFFAAPASGGTARRLIHNMNVRSPSISPDGKRIVFVSNEAGPTQVWIAGVDGSNPRQLTNGDSTGMPSFSADGRSIVYVTVGESQYVWRLDLDDGAVPEQLTRVPTGNAALSPDGRWLLCRMRSTEPGAPLWRTAVVPVGRAGEPRYFDVPRVSGPPRLQWHPDGRSFVYLDYRGGVANVWRQDLDGSDPVALTAFTRGAIYAFDLAPDGRRLALARGEPASDAVLIRNFR